MLNITGIRALSDDDDYEITLSDNGVSNSFTLQANDPMGCVRSWDNALDSLSRQQQNGIFEALWAFHSARYPVSKSLESGSVRSEETAEDIKARARAYQNIIDKMNATNKVPESFTVLQKHLSDMQK